MEPPVLTPPEITLPACIFSGLRKELGNISGKRSSSKLLQKVGYRTGSSASTAFKDGLNSTVLETMQSTFWTHLCDFFSCRGWGTLVVDSDHPRLGFLTSNDWAEAMTDEADHNASCCFSTGFISGLLSEIAGSPVAVLEAKCRARGDTACKFAFGAEQAVRELYGQLLVEADLNAT
jgi:hypothetical protein